MTKHFIIRNSFLFMLMGSLFYVPMGHGFPWSSSSRSNSSQEKLNHKFIEAAKSNNLELLKELWKKGASSLSHDSKGNTALHWAAVYDSKGTTIDWLIEVVKIPLEVLGDEGKTPLLLAVQKGNRSAMYRLYEQGASLIACDAQGYTALHVAAKRGEESLIIWLLEQKKIDVNQPGLDGKTAFMFAIEKADIYLLQLLKSHGADPCAIDNEGNTALHIAVLFDTEGKMLKWLMRVCKIDINTPNKHQVTPFLLAVSTGNIKMLIFLKSRGADVTATDAEGKNALNYAENEIIVEWLQKKCKLKPTVPLSA